MVILDVIGEPTFRLPVKELSVKSANKTDFVYVFLFLHLDLPQVTELVDNDTGEDLHEHH